MSEKLVTIYYPYTDIVKYIALEVNSIKRLLINNLCSKCAYKGAIKWNPYNQVYQCHNCGQAYVDKKDNEKR